MSLVPGLLAAVLLVVGPFHAAAAAASLESCYQQCENIGVVSPTPSKALPPVDACKKGCRLSSLYSVMNFHSFDSDSAKQSKTDCLSACADSFYHTEHKEACQSGCKFASKEDEDETMSLLPDDFFTGFGGGDRMTGMFRMPDMFAQINSMMNDMLDWSPPMLSSFDEDGDDDKVVVGASNGGRGNSMSVSWSSFMQNDNGKVTVIKSPPKVVINNRVVPVLVPGDDSDTHTYSVDDDNAEVNTAYAFKDTILEPEASVLLAVADKAEPTLVADDKGEGNDAAVSSEDDGNANWFACIAYKSGLPRWFLLATLLISVVAMIYICCSATTSDTKGKKRRGGGEDDEELLIATVEEKKKLWLDDPPSALLVPVHCMPQVDGDQQTAGPLPIKVKLGQQDDAGMGGKL